MFRAKKLDIGGFISTRVIRDHTKRSVGHRSYKSRHQIRSHSVEKFLKSSKSKGADIIISTDYYYASTICIAVTQRHAEHTSLHADTFWLSRNRQALRYIIRNTTLPQRARAQAQLQLSQMHAYTRFTQINNRCIEGGKSRGVLKDFKMSRVRS